MHRNPFKPHKDRPPMATLFDPSAYAAKLVESAASSALSGDDWVARFVAHVIEAGSPVADDEFRNELPSYAKNIAPSYLATRTEYADPEEAAETDISYWESEE